MKRHTAVILLIMVALAFACSNERCSQPEDTNGEPFAIEIYPEITCDAAPGQTCVFLVQFKHASDADSIDLSARILKGGTYDPTIHIPISSIDPGWIGEVEVRIDRFGEGIDTLVVMIEAMADTVVASDTCAICVSESWGDAEPYATEVFYGFATWLEANEPAMGITHGTPWRGTVVVPHICGTGNYLFFSPDWEMGLTWVVSPPPWDRVSMYLRRRHAEIAPSYALVISSWEEHSEPTLTDPPSAVTR